jgi:uncharacterized protein
MNDLKSTFSATQFVPAPLEKVFQFFSEAQNLEIITPPWLNFHMLRKSTEQIQSGTIIDYKLNIHGVPVKWRTEITDWVPNVSFVDQQLKGPYHTWHHLHTFKAVEGGTEIGDLVTYQVPLGALGKFFLHAWIRRDVNTIFAYRQKKIEELFPR